MTIDLDKLKTGDLLLFSAHLSFNPLNIFSLLIEFFTKRPYSHIGMILRDPTWIKPDLKGLFYGNLLLKELLIHKMQKLNLVFK